jgi:hypothetical protein
MTEEPFVAPEPEPEPEEILAPEPEEEPTPVTRSEEMPEDDGSLDDDAPTPVFKTADGPSEKEAPVVSNKKEQIRSPEAEPKGDLTNKEAKRAVSIRKVIRRK